MAKSPKVKTVQLEDLVNGRLNELGQEVPDPTPVEMPAGFKHPESLESQIRRLVRGAMSDASEQAGFESFDDADDFEIEDDDIDPATPYEMEFDPTLNREISPDMIEKNPDYFRDKFMENAVQDEVTEDHIEKQGRKFPFFWRKKKRADQPEGPEGGSPEPTPSDPDDSA